ncbi:MAG: hypothetical protein ACI8XC_000175 [Gammaproteobacteria bacterium]|jgi:hypothetical protein
MPFTPIHMGPGILVKSILQGSFSLMVFGWTQIVMDLQPLIVMITGEGDLHGYTHTYLGAVIIAVMSALSGKYLSQIGLVLIAVSRENPIKIKWWVAFLSAMIGSLSHVYLDSIMHSDVQPFYPVLMTNYFFGIVSISNLHKLCLYSGLLGAIIYYSTNWSKIKIK